MDNSVDKMWINKYIVIPPFYRDKHTSSNSRATVGLGGVNKLYTNSAVNELFSITTLILTFYRIYIYILF